MRFTNLLQLALDDLTTIYERLYFSKKTKINLNYEINTQKNKHWIVKRIEQQVI